MKLNIAEQFLWDRSFFVFSPKNIGHIRTSVFYLIEWGFSYEALIQMPIEEFLDYSKLLYKHKMKENDQQEDGTVNKKPDGKTIGQVAPNFNANIRK